MSPKFAHSSKSVYLFPVSHAKKIHGSITISTSVTVLYLVVAVNELLVTVPDSVIKLVVVNTVIDLFVTLLVTFVKE